MTIPIELGSALFVLAACIGFSVVLVAFAQLEEFILFRVPAAAALLLHGLEVITLSEGGPTLVAVDSVLFFRRRLPAQSRWPFARLAYALRGALLVLRGVVKIEA